MGDVVDVAAEMKIRATLLLVALVAATAAGQTVPNRPVETRVLNGSR